MSVRPSHRPGLVVSPYSSTVDTFINLLCNRDGRTSSVQAPRTYIPYLLLTYSIMLAFEYGVQTVLDRGSLPPHPLVLVALPSLSLCLSSLFLPHPLSLSLSQYRSPADYGKVGGSGSSTRLERKNERTTSTAGLPASIPWFGLVSSLASALLLVVLTEYGVPNTTLRYGVRYLAHPILFRPLIPAPSIHPHISLPPSSSPSPSHPVRRPPQSSFHTDPNLTREPTLSFNLPFFPSKPFLLFASLRPHPRFPAHPQARSIGSIRTRCTHASPFATHPSTASYHCVIRFNAYLSLSLYLASLLFSLLLVLLDLHCRPVAASPRLLLRTTCTQKVSRFTYFLPNTNLAVFQRPAPRRPQKPPQLSNVDAPNAIPSVFFSCLNLAYSFRARSSHAHNPGTRQPNRRLPNSTVPSVLLTSPGFIRRLLCCVLYEELSSNTSSLL